MRKTEKMLVTSIFSLFLPVFSKDAFYQHFLLFQPNIFEKLPSSRSVKKWIFWYRLNPIITSTEVVISLQHGPMFKRLLRVNFLYFLCVINKRPICINPFPNKPWFLRVCKNIKRSLLKTLHVKEKLLVTSNLPFFQQCLLPVWRIFYHFQ